MKTKDYLCFVCGTSFTLPENPQKKDEKPSCPHCNSTNVLEVNFSSLFSGG